MAWTDIPAAGAKLRAAILRALITELRPVRGLVTADQTFTPSSTTLQNITELALPVAASTNYEFDAVIFYDTGTTPDIKFAATFPSGATFTWGPASLKFDGTDFQSQFTAKHRQTAGTNTELAAAGLGSGTVVNIQLRGTLKVSTTAGTLQIQGAQNTSNASNTIVKADSWARLTPAL